MPYLNTKKQFIIIIIIIHRPRTACGRDTVVVMLVSVCVCVKIF